MTSDINRQDVVQTQEDDYSGVPYKDASEYLLRLGRRNGFITYDDVLEVMPDAEFEMDLLEDLFSSLFEQGIEVGQHRESQVENLVAITEFDGQLKPVLLKLDGTYSFLQTPYTHNFYSIIPEHKALKEAVAELEFLVNVPTIKERDLQDFFERHPNMILDDEYRKAHAHIMLTRHDGILIPDFLLEPIDQGGLCDILDLKLPTSKIYIRKKNRIRFSSAVQESCAQVREYASFFDEESNRNLIREKYGLLAYKPKMIVVIGRRDNIDPIEVKKMRLDLPNFDLRTYDDILDRAKFKFKR